MKLLFENWRKFVQEGIDQETGQPDFKYYAFDWDDNILMMPTFIILKDSADQDIGMGTADFAEYRTLIGKEDFEYNGAIITGFADEPFRNFRHPTGDEQFVEDSMTAELGPSWDDFVECLNGGSIFAIITARGHHPENLKSAVRALIEAERDGIKKETVMKNVQKYRDLAAMGTGEGEDIIEQYLDMCRFHPVSFSGAGAENPEEAKLKALKEFMTYVRQMNQDLPTTVGFSDDDPGNIDVIEKNKDILTGADKMTGEKNLILTIKYTGHLPREGSLDEKKNGLTSTKEV
jgi:hypothetical protein